MKLIRFFRSRSSEFHRKLIQVLSMVLYNANFRGFRTGTICRGPLKQVCVPGLNCYSCPGAVASCPLGALQSSFNSFPSAIPLYVVGLLLLFGVLLGRAVCSFLCPIGLIQEWLYKIPTPKLKKSAFTRKLSYLKYVILAVTVVILPLYFLISTGVVTPAFCKWICPAGTLEGGVPLVTMNEGLRSQAGALFNWKIFLLVAFLVSSVFIHRPFCRFICPLGAIYSFFNRIAIIGVKVDEKKCIGCDKCVRFCKMDVKKINDRECIRCGACAKVCPTGAVCWRIKKNDPPKGEN